MELCFCASLKKPVATECSQPNETYRELRADLPLLAWKRPVAELAPLKALVQQLFAHTNSQWHRWPPGSPLEKSRTEN